MPSTTTIQKSQLKFPHIIAVSATELPESSLCVSILAALGCAHMMVLRLKSDFRAKEN